MSITAQTRQRRVVALSGGVGGAKMALGLLHVVPPEQLTVIVNTGDDFEHLGLAISPDIDTALYSLAGIANPETGWGRRDETWTFMQAMESLGGETWFRLGDGDLALHVERTRRLKAGASLTTVIAEFARRLGITAQVLPMSDAPVRTRVTTDVGELDFQDYFVRRQCQPRVAALRFAGVEAAAPTAQVCAALTAPDVDAIIICPSNPYLSIDPILALPGMRELLRQTAAPVIAISPLVGGAAVKGPTAKIMNELGISVSPLAVAQHYGGLLDGFVLDVRDAAVEAELAAIGLPTRVTDTLMKSLADRQRLAQTTLDFARTLSQRKAAHP
ncbi:MAG: 2-phospho-L-lactate transferase [Sterolibacterium sp.]|jgi:LPPG:FO 2-phospho-L-lactate transferase|nr:2-phospho-L-lactate transferase [Sterolibacterium sp.]